MRSIALAAALCVLALIVIPDAQTSARVLKDTTGAPMPGATMILASITAAGSFQTEGGKPPTTARWTARAVVSGGIVSQSRQVSVDANGHVEVTNTRGNMRCSADVDPAAAQKIEAAIARSNPEKWQESYVLESNPHGCCDQASTELAVDRTDPRRRRTSSHTRWFTDSKHRVPEEVAALFDVVWEMRKACEL